MSNTQTAECSVESIIAQVLGLSSEDAKKKIRPSTKLEDLALDAWDRQEISIAILGQLKVQMSPADIYFSKTVENLIANVRAKQSTL